ncbi:MAG: ribose-5-phosphate isomerase RpiA [Candidatus Sumerlaeia bacterium]|nr:ribose-5-phosphate isomerase RpiA [Candidatus Sumerlaeia bacterium]
MLDQEKIMAGRRAAEMVKSGMIVGLGTGSTSAKMIQEVGARVKAGELEIRAVCTSSRTEEMAKSFGIPILPLSKAHPIDIYLDGADEVDPEGRMIKGGGGALLREKLVATNSACRVIMIDSTKKVAKLGGFPLPVEIVRFGSDVILAEIEKLLPDCRAHLRTDGVGEPYETDERHHIVDVIFQDHIDNPEKLDNDLLKIPGVVETGLFFGLCDILVTGAQESATVEVLNEKVENA